MQQGRVSRTAIAVAYGRAYHQVAGEPRIFTDPLAVPITGAAAPVVIDRVEAVQRARGVDPAMSSSFLAARSRFAEETIAAAAGAGATQVVVLGAGLDTFAYRNPHPGLRVIEVDHPDTQAWKRDRLAEAGIPVPDGVGFAPVDFETGTLATGLRSAGFDPGAATVFVWLGVVMYLTAETIASTLRFVADRSGAAWLVFDYLNPPADAAQRQRADRYAAAGEPWVSFLTAAEIATTLRTNGFDAIDDIASPDLIAGYLGGPAVPATAPPRVVRAYRGGPPTV